VKTESFYLESFHGTLNKSSAVADMGDRLATIDMGREDGGAVMPLLGEGAGSQCGLGRSLLPYQMTS